MSKLLHNGISGVMQSWLKSYLSKRNNMSQSKPADLKCQTLHYWFCEALCWANTFLLYINNFINLHINFVHLADITTVSASDSYINNAHATVIGEVVSGRHR